MNRRFKYCCCHFPTFGLISTEIKLVFSDVIRKKGGTEHKEWWLFRPIFLPLSTILHNNSENRKSTLVFCYVKFGKWAWLPFILESIGCVEAIWSFLNLILLNEKKLLISIEQIMIELHKNLTNSFACKQIMNDNAQWMEAESAASDSFSMHLYFEIEYLSLQISPTAKYKTWLFQDCENKQQPCICIVYITRYIHSSLIWSLNMYKMRFLS